MKLHMLLAMTTVLTGAGCAMDVGGDAEDDGDLVEVEDVDPGPLSADLLASVPEDGERPDLIAASGNRLGNAGFEASFANNPAEAYENWYTNGSAGRVSYVKLYDSFSLRVNGATAPFAAATQMIRVDGNGTYSVKVAAKVSKRGAVRQRAYVFFYGLFGDLQGKASMPIHTAAFTWHDEYMEVKAPGGAWYMTVSLGKGWNCDDIAECGGGTVFYDGAVVRSL